MTPASLQGGRAVWRRIVSQAPVFVRARDGAIAAEFALLVPAVLIIVFAVIFLARVLWYQNALQSAVEEAARCYGLNRASCDTVGEVRTYAANRTVGFTPDTAVFTPAIVGTNRCVTAAYPVSSGIPFIPLSLTVGAEACRPV